MKCLNCNKIVDDGDIFCGYCGVHLQKYAMYVQRQELLKQKQMNRSFRVKLRTAENNLVQLQKAREKEIKTLENSRWEKIGNAFAYNVTEGKIKINQKEYKFSDIKGAEIKTNDGFRTVSKTVGKTKGKSKKHVSLVGGVAGGLIAGPIGAVVGGSTLGKTTNKGKTNETTTTNDIPVCYRMSVCVDINGFNTEIVTLATTADQSGIIYGTAQRTSQNIVDKLRELSAMPVPESWLSVEEEESIKVLDRKIAEAKKELKEIREENQI